MSFFKHDHAIVESTKIGAGTRIWAFAHILPGASVGTDCNICDHVFIENDVSVGDRVTIKPGVQLWDGVRLEDDVFVGPNVTFSNDPFPRSRQRPAAFATTIVRQGASIGANATILPGIEIGRNAMVGAGAVVTRNVPANALVVGNPARLRRYLTTSPTEQAQTVSAGPEGLQKSGVLGVYLKQVPVVRDLRGNLSFGEFPGHIPFVPKRYFIVFDVPSKEIRGEHGHKECEQFLICIRGSCSVVVDDGKNREEYQLDRPTLGLYIPPGVWGAQYNYSADAMLLVLASHQYDANDYLRNYDEFLALKS